MGKSYQDIDYRLRIAKTVERKMLCTLFQQLSLFMPLPEYRYIGLGSVAFLDFNLFHKNLRIEKMISIEKEISDQKRFEFNKPYKSIDLVFGKTNDVLIDLPIEENSIIWLDYDDPLSTFMLNDISSVVSRIGSGSVFCISFNTTHDNYKDNKSERIALLKNRIDPSYIPVYVNESFELNKSGIQQVYYDIVKFLVNKKIAERKNNGENINFIQIIYYTYSDGAPMTTVGWLFFDDSASEKIEQFKSILGNLIIDSDKNFNISIPKLTLKEMKEIEYHFPNLKECISVYDVNSSNGFLPPSDIKSYFSIYKNFSLFGEIQL